MRRRRRAAAGSSAATSADASAVGSSHAITPLRPSVRGGACVCVRVRARVGAGGWVRVGGWALLGVCTGGVVLGVVPRIKTDVRVAACEKCSFGEAHVTRQGGQARTGGREKNSMQRPKIGRGIRRGGGRGTGGGGAGGGGRARGRRRGGAAG